MTLDRFCVNFFLLMGSERALRIKLFCRQQIEMAVRTRRGLIALLSFSLIWFLSLTGLVAAAKGAIVFEAIGFGAWPTLPSFVYWCGGLIAFSLMPLILTADLFVSDGQRRTLRLYVLRRTRVEILLGRFIGQVILLAIYAALGSICAWGYFLWENAVFPLGYRHLIGLCALHFWSMGLPVIGCVSFFSIGASSPRRAMMSVIALWSAVTLLRFNLFYDTPLFDAFAYVIPGHQLPLLFDKTATQTLPYLAIPLLQSIVFLGISIFRFRRRDV